MIFSLRWLKRSMGLRILSVLAWMMLVSTAVNAASGGMDMAAMHAGHAVASLDAGQAANMGAMLHGIHGTADLSCCGDHLAQGCDCHSACGNALPPVAAFFVISASFALVYASPSLVLAPSPNPASPWRPPSA